MFLVSSDVIGTLVKLLLQQNKLKMSLKITISLHAFEIIK